MKNQMIKVGTVVPKMKVGDVSYNVKEIIQTIKKHKDCGILLFPELCVTGYSCGDLFGQNPLIEEGIKGLTQIAKATEKLSGMSVVVGVPIPYENQLYNCAAIVSGGSIVGLIPKSHIPTYSEFYEGRYFTSGNKVFGRTIDLCGYEVPFGIDVLAKDETTGAILGVDICEDLWVPDKPSTHACLAGANLIVNLSASDEIIGKQEFRRQMVLQQSAGCYCGYLYVSSGVGESSTDLVFSGHTVISENGNLLEERIFEEQTSVTTALIDLEKIQYNRLHQNTFVTQDSDWYRFVPTQIACLGGKSELPVSSFVSLLKKEHYSISRYPFVPADEEERSKRCQRILQIQANGLATRLRATGIRTLVLGISGGLDSTLALLVCHEVKKMLKDVRILGYTLPSKGNTSDLTYKNAIALMKALKVDAREIEIGKGVKDHLVQIGHGGTYKNENDTTYENAQARMRTYILMDVANMENGLVVGTGDMSELALGWCTYNGDHMSMYGVNGSIPKTLVQYLCRTYAMTCGDKALEKVLLSICDTPISPELTPNQKGKIAQKTEEKIGKYDLNDFFLFYCLRYGFTPEKIIALALVAYPELTKEHVKEAALRFYRRFFYQQFKRSCLPDGPKVGSVSLSPRGDWRMPSDASPELWLERIKKA